MTVFQLEVGNAYRIEDIPETHRDLFLACYHQGDCDPDVEQAIPHFSIDDPDGLREYLKTFGAWDSDDLSDDKANMGRLLWIMSNDIQDRDEAYIGE